MLKNTLRSLENGFTVSYSEYDKYSKSIKRYFIFELEYIVFINVTVFTEVMLVNDITPELLKLVESGHASIQYLQEQ